MRALVFSFLALTACSTDQPPPAADPSSSAETMALPPAKRPRQKEGQTCGGIAGLLCEDALQCVMNGPIHPDETGVCMK